jgi:hypothetical protein
VFSALFARAISHTRFASSDLGPGLPLFLGCDGVVGNMDSWAGITAGNIGCSMVSGVGAGGACVVVAGFLRSQARRSSPPSESSPSSLEKKELFVIEASSIFII